MTIASTGQLNALAAIDKAPLHISLLNLRAEQVDLSSAALAPMMMSTIEGLISMQRSKTARLMQSRY